MTDINLKTLTPDTSLPTTGFLFGADSQASTNPSVYGVTTAITAILGNAASTDVLAFNSDTILARDTTNTLAQRNGVNAQTFRLYNTYTDASNYERGVFDWTTTANVLTIGTQNAGTGSARNLQFVVGGVNKLDFGVSLADNWFYTSNTASKTGIAVRNTNATSASSFTAYSSLNLGASCEFGFWNISKAAYGVIAANAGYIYANTTAGFNIACDNGPIVFGSAVGANIERLRVTTAGLLTFGGATSSFPALKRSTTFLQARLADDSAFTNIQGKLTTDTAYTAGSVVPTGYITLYDSTGTAYRVPCLV
jgi:hypothetical protein